MYIFVKRPLYQQIFTMLPLSSFDLLLKLKLLPYIQPGHDFQATADIEFQFHINYVLPRI